ncbi:Mss4-like protein [Plectosphaerella cucumerina]|uniref:Mss4-like protein n=1 Tax=Plectosphaerella cucumerina TaxID=40658 RepID=A0A8K0T9V9_9PEZI|nr:Mss4-like protein [Plectosphaerella cucumerina]
MSEVTIQLQCHCKANTFTATIPSSSLPLTSTWCHCTSCRHATGNLYQSDITWPNPNEDVSRLRAYDFSARLRDYSCPTCRCRMLTRDVENNFMYAPIGSLSNLPGLVKIVSNIFVGDTIDGGASMWMRHTSDGKHAPRWTASSQKGDELPFEWPGKAPPHDMKVKPSLTPLWCHCKGVKFFLRPGTDLLSLPSDKIPWYVDKPTGRYVAQADACDSCLKTSGADIAYWTWAPFTHISTTETPSDQPEFRTKADFLDAVVCKDPKVGTLGVYQSSQHGHRFSCSVCAAVFFFAGDKHAEQVDIAVGVLDHPDGARAEGLLKWDMSKIEFAEDGKGGWREELYDSVVRQATTWQGTVASKAKL